MVLATVVSHVEATTVVKGSTREEGGSANLNPVSQQLPQQLSEPHLRPCIRQGDQNAEIVPYSSELFGPANAMSRLDDDESPEHDTGGCQCILRKPMTTPA